MNWKRGFLQVWLWGCALWSLFMFWMFIRGLDYDMPLSLFLAWVFFIAAPWALTMLVRWIFMRFRGE
jgi:hypothetical protein